MKNKSNEKFIIARRARQTIDYIIKNTENFPNKYTILKNNIIKTSYLMLENIYRANIFQDIEDKTIAIKLSFKNNFFYWQMYKLCIYC